MTVEAVSSDPAPSDMARGSSFYTAMRVLPAPRREAMYAIYAFCRAVDDIADGTEAPAEKRRGLSQWREEIDALYAGRPRHPIARNLAEAVRRFDLKKQHFLEVIEGMEMDAAIDIVAPDLATFDLYCDRVASAVGRLSICVFGAPGAAGEAVAYSLGRALQTTNILRDIAEDAERGRLYLPAEFLARHDVPTRDVSKILAHPGLPAACRDLAKLALEHFRAADEAMARCPRAAMRPAKLMGAVYRRYLDRLMAGQWRDLRQPVRLPLWLKIWILVRHGIF